MAMRWLSPALHRPPCPCIVVAMRMLWILSGFAVCVGTWIVWTFNRFVQQRNMLREAWSGIDVQLKRRHDVVPVLVACVEGYRSHERNLFERIATARTQALQAHDTRETAAAEQELARGLRQLLAIAEAYPQLKASDNFRDLARQLVEIEEQLQFARRYYNGTAKILNNLIETFPTLLIARLFGFHPAEFFEVESATERAVPEVNT
jgi:LemA protein